MREDSATHANRPSLAPRRFEPIPALEPNTEERPTPGRVPWMELVSDPGHPAIGVACSSNETNQPDPAASLSGLIHDARNLVTALDLYCDLLGTPGVLSSSCHHYADELRLIAGGSRRILEKLAATESTRNISAQAQNDGLHPRESTLPVLTFPSPRTSAAERSATQRMLLSEQGIQPASESAAPGQPPAKTQGPTALRQRPTSFQQISDTVESFSRGARWKPFVSTQPIANLADEVLANHNLLCALAGPGITVGLSLYGGKQPISMSSDDLTRILINLTKNAAEAMPQGGHIQIVLEEFSDHLCLSIGDTGSGLLCSTLEEIFTAGYTSHVEAQDPLGKLSGLQAPHRGLGLAIVRSIVAAAGGSVTAANRSDLDSQLPSLPCAGGVTIAGAIFRLDFPIQV